MHDHITIDKFIHLRAQGKSYAKIYQEIGASPATLVRWARTYRAQIQEKQALEAEAIQENLFPSALEKWEHLGSQLQQVQRELSIRGLSDVSTVALFHLAARLRAEIEREKAKLIFPEDDPSNPSDESDPNSLPPQNETK